MLEESGYVFLILYNLQHRSQIGRGIHVYILFLYWSMEHILCLCPYIYCSGRSHGNPTKIILFCIQSTCNRKVAAGVEYLLIPCWRHWRPLTSAETSTIFFFFGKTLPQDLCLVFSGLLGFHLVHVTLSHCTAAPSRVRPHGMEIRQIISTAYLHEKSTLNCADFYAEFGGVG